MAELAERYRPRFHFSPRVNWCNDPNGLVWFEGEYHLFFQYNPFGDVWGHMSWGHAVSTDLDHWEELPVALAEDESGMIFSGSAVYDRHNSSGLAPDGAAPLVAIYTRHQPGTLQHQAQCLAFSTDRGRSWTKYAGNPVLDIGLPHFRDPKVFWHAPTARWVMIVALSDQNKISLYASTDLKTWCHLSDFGPAGGGGQLWECPDLFALPVLGETPAEKWVLKVDMFEGGVSGGASAQYFVGSFDGMRFVPDRRADGSELWGWADFGKDFYAAVTWSNLPTQLARPVWIGWMSAHAYAASLPTSPWRGAMTLPRSLALSPRPGGPTLIQQPILDIERLRSAPRSIAPASLANGEMALASFGGAAGRLEIEFKLSHADAEQSGLLLIWASGDELRLGVHRPNQAVFIDRGCAGLMTENSAFTGIRYAPYEFGPGASLDMRVIVDSCSIEIFADYGAISITELIFPRGHLTDLLLLARNGSVNLDEMTIWTLSAASRG